MITEFQILLSVDQRNLYLLFDKNINRAVVLLDIEKTFIKLLKNSYFYNIARIYINTFFYNNIRYFFGDLDS